ncbi:hypothetical protein C2S52_000380 [Perilla frutescens var. hirtella]|nr:hypothetical protein C2S52_000380 [Perilla frutescens var. hirtella]
MSRCFPYPPPGYALSSAGNEALIESIKLQKQKVKAEEHTKKEKKREKKEKKKNKKEKKDKKSRNLGSSDIVHGHHIGEKLWADAKVDFSNKGSKTEPEQLERSSLTEEHAKPVCLRLPSSSSDSTENSNKRKRQPSPVDVSRGHGKIIRIRLSKKKNQSDASVDDQKHCSTSGRTHFPAQIDNDIASTQRNEGFCSTSGSAGNVGRRLVLKTSGESSKQIATAAPALQTIALPAADAATTTLSKEGLIYRNLIENWVPPQLQDVCFDGGDEDWLFGSKGKVEQPEKRSMCRDDIMSCSNTSSLWPRVQYLPEVDIYALPFTVPF